MGKIRIKSFDESSAEDEAKLKAKREAKKALRQAQDGAEKARISGMGGGQRVKTVGPSEEEIMATVEPVAKDAIEAQLEASEELSKVDASEQITETKDKKKKKEKFANKNVKAESKRHKANSSLVSKTQNYNLDQALEALKKFQKGKFDETVELHINVKEKGISGQITLPHGTGKKRVIKIADDAIISEVAKGKINFDILVAHPSMMPQLARVAKILGPRGLMPNPKNGTISPNPDEAVKKLEGGQMNYKTESEHPIIHASVGKVSFEDKMLKENINAFITSVGKEKINNITLKSTMSPAIRLSI